MGNPYETASERRSILGPTLSFKGELCADEDLVIQGKVEGAIVHNQRLTIGSEGRVTATIAAEQVIIEGTVEGDVRGTSSVVIKDCASVRGNITSPTVSIHQGASFNGAIDMSQRRAAAVEDLSTTAAPSAA